MADAFDVSGHCLCGAVSYKAKAASNDVSACHCTMCRRWSAGPFIAFIHEGSVNFSGSENIAVYKSSDWAERGFCKVCGSPLYYHLSGSAYYALSASTIDDQSRLRLARQIFIEEKPPYYDFANDTPCLTGAEAVAAFAASRETQ